MTVAAIDRETLNSARSLVRALDDGPLFFARDILGHDSWSIPQQVMRAISTPRARVAVKACHSSSKTHTAADVCLWWTLRGGIAVTTAPTWMQVKQLLWAEIHKSFEEAKMRRFPLGGKLNSTDWQISPQNYALGLSTNQAVRFQGFHGTILIILDEAPGVRPDIWEAIEGIRAGGDVRILALGNPTIASGPFYDAFTTARSGWRTFTISAFDTPNFDGVRGSTTEESLDNLRALTEDELAISPRPYLTNRQWVREKMDEWGVEHPLFQSRVLGQFPAQSEDALLSLTWLEQAQLRAHENPRNLPITAGVDVAGPGEDETVVAVRQGANLLAEYAFAQADPRGEVMAVLAQYTPLLTTVNVDSVGMGWYFALHLQESLGDVTVVPVNVGTAALEPEMYTNLKAELYWNLRERFKAGAARALAGSEDDERSVMSERTVAQLAGIRYRHNSRGKVLIESKDEARKRGVKSPDRAEAWMLAFADLPLPVDENVVYAGDDARVRISPF